MLSAGVGQSTRRGYLGSIVAYERFCEYFRLTPWPATVRTLARFITSKAWGDEFIPGGHKRCGRGAMSNILSGLRSHHIDLGLETEIFKSPLLARLLAGVASIFPREPRPPKVPVTRGLLIRLMSPAATAVKSVHDFLTLNAAFTVAWSGFLRLGEFTWTKADMADVNTFRKTQLTRRCVSLASEGYIRLLLPRSKTDKTHQGTTILLTPSSNETPCPVRALQVLFPLPGHPSGALFSFENGRPFDRGNVSRALGRRLRRLGITTSGITGHSFRKGASQTAFDDGLARNRTMLIGRWTSDAVDRYWESNDQQQLAVHRDFMAGRLPPAVTAAPHSSIT